MKRERVSTTQRSRFTVDRLGKATAKYDDWPCFFGNNEVRINCVDFCHDSAITKQALMALTAPKIENLGNF